MGMREESELFLNLQKTFLDVSTIPKGFTPLDQVSNPIGQDLYGVGLPQDLKVQYDIPLVPTTFDIPLVPRMDINDNIIYEPMVQQTQPLTAVVPLREPEGIERFLTNPLGSGVDLTEVTQRLVNIELKLNKILQLSQFGTAFGLVSYSRGY
jgi:hypothetical protein